MLRILYFAHDLADPAVRRRVLALQAGDAVALDIAAENAHWFDSAGRVVSSAVPTAA